MQHEHIGGKLASKLVGCHRELAAAPCQSPLTIHMVHTAYPKLDPATRQCSGAHPAHTQPCAGSTNHSFSLPRAHPMQARLMQRYWSSRLLMMQASSTTGSGSKASSVPSSSACIAIPAGSSNSVVIAGTEGNARVLGPWPELQGPPATLVLSSQNMDREAHRLRHLPSRCIVPGTGDGTQQADNAYRLIRSTWAGQGRCSSMP